MQACVTKTAFLLVHQNSGQWKFIEKLSLIRLPQFKSRPFMLLKFCPCKCCGLSQMMWTRVRLWSNFCTISWTLQSQLIAFRSIRRYSNAGNPSNAFGSKFSMLLLNNSLDESLNRLELIADEILFERFDWWVLTVVVIYLPPHLVSAKWTYSHWDDANRYCAAL